MASKLPVGDDLDDDDFEDSEELYNVDDDKFPVADEDLSDDEPDTPRTPAGQSATARRARSGGAGRRKSADVGGPSPGSSYPGPGMVSPRSTLSPDSSPGFLQRVSAPQMTGKQNQPEDPKQRPEGSGRSPLQVEK